MGAEPVEEEFWVWGTDDGFWSEEVRLVNTHKPDACSGENCVLHNPSDHHMIEWPLLWRGDIGVMERTCPHGIGHPDPDDLAHRIRVGRASRSHGCDGCCHPPEEEENLDG